MSILVATLERSLLAPGLVAEHDRLVVAFSGGPDSTALLHGLCCLSASHRLRLYAAHFDHGLDQGSAERARTAAALANRLGVPCTVEQSSGPPSARESREAEARRRRYQFLERVRQQVDARFIVTAHHRDDQVETVLLRLLYGSGLAGLAGVKPRHGYVLRPLLERSAAELRAAVGASGLQPTDDPTNRDLAIPRNWVRHRLLPSLRRRHAKLDALVGALAAAACGAASSVDAVLEERLRVRRGPGRAETRLEHFLALPSVLWPHALALLHRQAGALYPPTAGALRELERQLARGRGMGIDSGSGWTLRLEQGSLSVRKKPADPTVFPYTRAVPGSVEVPELSLRLQLPREQTRPPGASRLSG